MDACLCVFDEVRYCLLTGTDDDLVNEVGGQSFLVRVGNSIYLFAWLHEAWKHVDLVHLLLEFTLGGG